MPRSGIDRRGFGLALTAGAAGLAAAGAPALAAEEDPLRGALTDVPGLKVGHFTHGRRPTGCTVVLVEAGAVCGVDVRGGAPGTRETDLLAPVNLVERVHAIVLSGGSAFGLDTATGVMRYLEEKRIGFDTGVARVPIVPAAILFDLNLGDPSLRPDAAAGYAAAKDAHDGPVTEGNVGAGAGATVGKLFGFARAMKGGLGSASVRLPGSAVVVSALVVVNAVGDVVEPASGRLLAGARAAVGPGLEDARRALLEGRLPGGAPRGENTTLGVVATNVRLSKTQATKVAQMAHDGLARTIRPAHTPWDGDTLFALSTGAVDDPGGEMLVGALAAEVVAAAVLRGVRAATGLPGLPSVRDLAR